MSSVHEVQRAIEARFGSRVASILKSKDHGGERLRKVLVEAMSGALADTPIRGAEVRVLEDSPEEAEVRQIMEEAEDGTVRLQIRFRAPGSAR